MSVFFCFFVLLFPRPSCFRLSRNELRDDTSFPPRARKMELYRFKTAFPFELKILQIISDSNSWHAFSGFTMWTPSARRCSSFDQFGKFLVTSSLAFSIKLFLFSIIFITFKLLYTWNRISQHTLETQASCCLGLGQQSTSRNTFGNTPRRS